MVDEDGHLYLIDSKRDYFTLDNGYVVYPQRIEEYVCEMVDEVEYAYLTGMNEP